MRQGSSTRNVLSGLSEFGLNGHTHKCMSSRPFSVSRCYRQRLQSTLNTSRMHCRCGKSREAVTCVRDIAMNDVLFKCTHPSFQRDQDLQNDEPSPSFCYQLPFPSLCRPSSRGAAVHFSLPDLSHQPSSRPYHGLGGRISTGTESEMSRRL